MEAQDRKLLEMELELWSSRMNAVQLAGLKMQAESELLKYQAKECQQEIARLQNALAPKKEAGGVQQEQVGSSGPGAEGPAA